MTDCSEKTHLHSLKVADPPHQSSLSRLIPRSTLRRLAGCSGSSGRHGDFYYNIFRLLVVREVGSDLHRTEQNKHNG